ncbi:GNAT family N-acetyltransferase [Rhodococcus oxybenzonivorans]|uniref:GNAT family N-acetyltransferase n=1 Tax=Rhodococcus oxybenzonivorans TaxID=1990687 RepID=UPI002954A54D|nr:GNAT family N-acetyltransferase [Rhodococcus oxybenzonivorans]MDV7351633.1 GNAT family N-acetyltransferase [Rhodococcus oxybenzonivorans]
MASQVQDNPQRNRYELIADGDVAGFIDYSAGDGVLTLTHTEVSDAFEGKGYAGRLVEDTLDDARSRGLGVLPECTYVQQWIRKHPDYRTVVPENDRSRFDLERSDDE